MSYEKRRYDNAPVAHLVLRLMHNVFQKKNKGKKSIDKLRIILFADNCNCSIISASKIEPPATIQTPEANPRCQECNLGQ